MILLFFCHKIHLNYCTRYHQNFSAKFGLSLAWPCTKLITNAFFWLFMVCEIAHFGYNGATVCILIHRQRSAWKQPIHSCTYDQNHKRSSALSTSLSHFYRGDANLSASVELASCLQHTTQCAHFQWLHDLQHTTQCAHIQWLRDLQHTAQCAHFQWLRDLRHTTQCAHFQWLRDRFCILVFCRTETCFYLNPDEGDEHEAAGNFVDDWGGDRHQHVRVEERVCAANDREKRKQADPNQSGNPFTPDFSSLLVFRFYLHCVSFCVFLFKSIWHRVSWLI